MLPWAGRMRDGRLAWRGTTVELPRNFFGHAIHGTGFDRTWDVVAADERSVELALRLGPSPRWPFAGEARQVVRLASDAIECRIEIRAGDAMPAAAGWHPWFRRFDEEPVSVAVPGDATLETRPDLIPTGVRQPVDGPTDLRAGPVLGNRRLDHAFVDVAGPSVVRWIDLELAIEAEPLRCVVVYTPADAFCVEPQTAWPDAIRLAGEGLDTGLVALEPGQALLAEMRWSWRLR
jgi:aldose 1-epimerase